MIYFDTQKIIYLKANKNKKKVIYIIIVIYTTSLNK